MSERQFTMRASSARGIPGVYLPLLQRAQARWEVGTALSRAQAARDLEEAVRRAATPSGAKDPSAARKAAKRVRDATLRASMKGASGGGGARR